MNTSGFSELERHKLGCLKSYFAELHSKTVNLYERISVEGTRNVILLQLKMAEIENLHRSISQLLDFEVELHHYEFSSLLHFWENMYHELFQVAENDDHNLSWLSSRYTSYIEQSTLVDEMLSLQLKK
ncbi:hypothetical protein [Listeria sp. ILCC797]|uniref:hypothetical protein n=1 Tax=Listeria sp. ILCC797 TaxID=1918333 RepID=UPI000B59578F|nr:hypothetical protein [Listeria sp. ILCC797]